MELPLYHLPQSENHRIGDWQNTVAFIKRAGTLFCGFPSCSGYYRIFPTAILIPAILPISGILTPVGKLMGLNWQMMVRCLSSFIAKETRWRRWEINGRDRCGADGTIEDFIDTCRGAGLSGRPGAFYSLCGHCGGNSITKPNPGAGRFFTVAYNWCCHSRWPLLFSNRASALRQPGR